jgi:hypothetical protein
VATTAERGYGAEHQAERKRLAPTVQAGRAYCTEPICLMDDRWIEPGTPWDLAHDRDAGPGRYHGPAHRRCNRSEGARWLALLKQLDLDDPREPALNRWTL